VDGISGAHEAASSSIPLINARCFDCAAAVPARHRPTKVRTCCGPMAGRHMASSANVSGLESARAEKRVTDKLIASYPQVVVHFNLVFPARAVNRNSSKHQDAPIM
jgi:hypothetical protein